MEQQTAQAQPAAFDYISEALATASPHFFGEKVSLAQFVDCLNRFVEVVNELDAIKKALFYGRDNELLDVPGELNCSSLVLDNPNKEEIVTIIHAIIGVATESGELVEALKLAGTQPQIVFDKVNLREEGGDSLWYFALLFKAIGTTFEEVQRINIAKLQKKRYKNAQFTAEAAQQENRDLAGERQLLEAGEQFKTELEGMGVKVGAVTVGAFDPLPFNQNEDKQQ